MALRRSKFGKTPSGKTYATHSYGDGERVTSITSDHKTTTRHKSKNKVQKTTAKTGTTPAGREYRSVRSTESGNAGVDSIRNVGYNHDAFVKLKPNSKFKRTTVKGKSDSPKEMGRHQTSTTADGKTTKTKSDVGVGYTTPKGNGKIKKGFSKR